MYKVAIVDDEYESAEKLMECFEAYTKEYNVEFNTTHFKNGLNFIDEYTADFDMVFMDIDMPHMNGLKTANELRKIDSSVVLIFVTFLAKYAIKGYEVDALDYVLKPVNYNSFKIKLDRAINNCIRKKKQEVLLPSPQGEIRLALDELKYVEISDHDLIYHTVQESIKGTGTMRIIEKILPADQFCKCNRCYLVNLRSVTRIEGNSVYLGTERLTISRPRKNEFMNAFHAYCVPVIRK